MASILLRQMEKNKKGAITTIRVAGFLGKRIEDIRIISGAEITVCRRAPLYDPVTVRVLNTTAPLHNNETDRIVVQID